MGNCARSILILCFITLIMTDDLNSLPHPMLPIVNGEIFYSGDDAMETSEKNEMNDVDK